jgi:hypothetical protein
MRFRQHFRGSKSMSELRRRMDKGKQREVPLPVEELYQFSPIVVDRQQNGSAIKRQKSRILRWRSARHSVSPSVREGLGLGDGRGTGLVLTA